MYVDGMRIGNDTEGEGVWWVEVLFRLSYVYIHTLLGNTFESGLL